MTSLTICPCWLQPLGHPVKSSRVRILSPRTFALSEPTVGRGPRSGKTYLFPNQESRALQRDAHHLVWIPGHRVGPKGNKSR